MKLDLACGKRKLEGFVGVDIAAIDGVDVVHDLFKFPWPFESDSIEEINCSHYIEHTDDLISFMNELGRILKVGAKVMIKAPYYTSMRAWQDPTHRRAISEATFSYFNKASRESNDLSHYGITCDFDFKGEYVLYPEFEGKSSEELEFAIKHFNNVVMDIHATLTKRPN